MDRISTARNNTAIAAKGGYGIIESRPFPSPVFT
jgi:hypothetical protein